MKREIKTTLALDGEKEFKKGLEDAQRQMRVLASESKSTSTAFKNNEDSVEALTAKNQILSRQIDQQEEIVKALTRAVSESAEKYGEADKKTDGYRIQLNNAQAALNKMESELGDGEAALRDMAVAEEKAGNEADEMRGSLKKTESGTKSLKDQIKEFTSSSVGKFTSVSAAIALVVSAVKKVWEAFEESADWADGILTLSAQTGIATDTLQELGYAARFVDVEVDTMTSGMAKIVKAINEAKISGDNFIETTGGLRIGLEDSNGQLKSSEELFYNAVDAIGTLANETDREAASQDLFGKSYQDLMPLIKAGTGALEEYAEQAKNTGVILDEGLVVALGKLDDKMEATEAQTESFMKKIAASNTDVGETMTMVKGIFDNFGPSIIWFFDTLGKRLNGMTWSEIDAFEKLELGAEAAGLSVDVFSSRVDSMTGTLMLASDGTKTWEQANTEAYGLVVDGIDEITWAYDTMRAQADTSYALIGEAQTAYQEKFAEFEAAVKETADAWTADLGGMFAAFDAGLATSQKELDNQSEVLLNNLQSQVDGFNGWADEIKKLSERGIDEGLLKKLRDMGPEAYSQIQALNNMSDTELGKYEALYKQLGVNINNEARNANEGLQTEVENALKNMQTTIENESDKMEALGEQLAKGVGAGFKSGEDYISRQMEKTLENAIANAKNRVEINSPSKLTARELGSPLGEGVAVGWEEEINNMVPGLTESMLTAVGRMQSAMEPKVSGGLVYDYSRGDIIIQQTNQFGDYSAGKGAASVRDLNRKLGVAFS